MKKIRLLLVEDNHQLRNGILRILKPHKDIAIIAESRNYNNACLKNQGLKPNIVLIDSELGNQDSLQMAESVKNDLLHAKIIFINFPLIETDIVPYVKVGANGFILKDAPHSDFVFTIRTVAEGFSVLPHLLVNYLFTQIVGHTGDDFRSKLQKSVCITKRESEVIGLIGNGMSNKEIGQKFHLSTCTVKTHIHNIMEKLALHTRLQIANYSYNDETRKTISNSIPRVYN